MQTFSVIAPTRADLAGGTLDIWPLYCLLGSTKTINVALDIYATTHFDVKPHSHCHIEIQSTDSEIYVFDKPVAPSVISSISPSLQLPVTLVSSYLENKSTLPSMLIRIRLQTEAPPGSGLGGSSALCVSITRGLARIFGDYIEEGWQIRLMEWVRDLEALHLETPTGTQDYLAALFGGLRCYRSGLGGITIQNYSESLIESYCKRQLVLYSGEIHQSGESNWEIFKKALEENATVRTGMQRISEVADQLDTLLRAQNPSWEDIGKTMSEEWQMRRRLFRVHTSRLDEIFDFLNRQNGILGAKVCGAAQGGSLIVLAEPDKIQDIHNACQENKIAVLRTRCTQQGSKVISQPSVPPG